METTIWGSNLGGGDEAEMWAALNKESPELSRSLSEKETTCRSNQDYFKSLRSIIIMIQATVINAVFAFLK